ncbi:uncharacterized protein TNCV_19911 [Trichonephila clavipes]|nr:uncharacterized protein TNCV_19911 [Trichonephila clavipes]
MDGSEKITPLVIRKSAKPRCFKGVNSFPTKYCSNKKAWMTTEHFNEWLPPRRIWLMWTIHSLNLMLNHPSLWEALPEQDLTFDDDVLVDTDIAVWGALSDTEIVA